MHRTANTAASTASRAAGQVERAGNRVSVPMAWNLGLGDFVRQTVAQARKDRLSAHAGNVAFRVLFALFPSLIAVFWLLKVAHADRLIRALHDLIGTAMPEAAARPIQDQLVYIPGDQANGALTAGAALALVVSLWAISGMVRAMMDALNAMYAVEERRPLWQRCALSLALGLAVVALLLAALFLIVFGAALARRTAQATGMGVLFRAGWSVVMWPVLTAFVLAACALLYYVAPDVQQRMRWVSMGAIVAAVLWLLFSVVYSIYVNRFASYREVYGALAGIALLMAYVYVSAFILLLGAEMNQVIEINHPDGKDEGERTPINQG